MDVFHWKTRRLLFLSRTGLGISFLKIWSFFDFSIASFETLWKFFKVFQEDLVICCVVRIVHIQNKCNGSDLEQFQRVFLTISLKISQEIALSTNFSIEFKVIGHFLWTFSSIELSKVDGFIGLEPAEIEQYTWCCGFFPPITLCHDFSDSMVIITFSQYKLFNLVILIKPFEFYSKMSFFCCQRRFSSSCSFCCGRSIWNDRKRSFSCLWFFCLL